MTPHNPTVEPIDTSPEERAQRILCQKVLMLAAQLFPGVGCSEDLRVEHVGAGSFHNVIGFTVPTLKLVADDSNSLHDKDHYTTEEEKYVIRIPRPDRTDHGNVDMRRDIAVLRGLEGKLDLVDLWVKYETERCPQEDNFALWNKIKDILRSLQRRGVLGETFRFSHGDLASRNILAGIINDSTVKIMGVVDWDFACFAPKFCVYRPPMDMWSGDEDVAIEECTKELIDILKEVASSDFVRYALSKEARLGRKMWNTLRDGMLGKPAGGMPRVISGSGNACILRTT